MGDLENPDRAGKLDQIRTVLPKTTQSNTLLHAKMESITDINNKLAQSYDVSLRIIVDVSKLLNQYIAFFNEIDALLVKLDSTVSDNLTGDYIKYINRLTSENIDKMTSEFKNQLNTILPLFNKNNIPSKNLTQYSDLLDQINREAKDAVVRMESAPPASSSIMGGRRGRGRKKN